MEIKLLNKDKEKVNLLFKNVDATTVNTLRRLIINNVPTLAIEDVTFIKNSSALYDEVIAHRLGLIPLQTDLKSYTLPKDCKCKGQGCVHCQLYMNLKAKGPCMVYSKELKTKDPKIKSVYENMPIVKLLKNQDLELEAIAVLGEGQQHSKFIPGLVFYKAYPMIDIKKCSGCGKCIEKCPQKILKLDGKNVKVVDIEKCNLCKACEEYCKEKAITVNGSKGDFIITIEPFGQLNVKEMLLEAIDVFDKKLKEFDKVIEEIK